MWGRTRHIASSIEVAVNTLPGKIMTQKPSSLSPDQKSMQAVAFPEDTTREPWYQRLRNSLWGYDFFISYHWASGGAYAVKLAAQLREKGYEVFLDRGEYAMGDKWKGVGEVALRNTQRLVLIATREAVFESEPVQHEVVKFTNRSRHCIPIFFGDTFVNDEKENPGKHIVLDRLPDDTLYIEDTAENLTASPAPHVVEKLKSAYGIMRRRKLRLTITLIGVSLLASFAVFASISWMNAVFARNYARKQEAIAQDERKNAENRLHLSERQKAEIAIQNGYRSIHSDHDVATGVVWYTVALDASGPLAKPLRDSARNLIAAWGQSLPRHSLPHVESVDALAFSPDGLTLATASGDSFKNTGEASLWDLSTGEPRGMPLKHDGKVSNMLFSPDGLTLATISAVGDLGADKTGEVRLWDTKSGQPRGEPLQHDHEAYEVLFSPDGKMLATACWKYEKKLGEVLLWDAATGQLHGQPLKHDDRVTSVSFSPDGRMLATASVDQRARLWDSATGLPRGAPLKHDSLVWAVSFSPDGRTLATASHDKTVRLWDSATGQPRGEPLKHRADLRAVSFSRVGLTLATASGDSIKNTGEASLWDLSTGEPRGMPLKHDCEVSNVLFSPDGLTLATLSGNLDVGRFGEVRLWDTKSGQPRGELLKHNSDVNDWSFSPDGKVLATASWNHEKELGEVMLWDAATGQLHGQPLKHDDRVTAVSFSPGGRLFATASADRRARLWDARNLLPRGEQLKHDGPVDTVSFSPDGRYLTTVGKDKSNLRQMRVWDAATGRALGESLQLGDHFLMAAFSPDGRTFATASGSEARLRNAATGLPRGERLQHDGDVYAISFSPDGRTLATASGDFFKGFGELRIWDVATGEPRGKMLKHAIAVTEVTFSPDGRVLATGSGGTARLWDTETGQPRGEPLEIDKGYITAVSFSPDGRMLATATRRDIPNSMEGIGDAWLWDVGNSQARSEPLKHAGPVTDVSFSPDGHTLATVSNDKTARLWDAATGQPRGEPFKHDGPVNAVTFSPDGLTFATASGHLGTRVTGEARLLDVVSPVPDDPVRVRLAVEVASWRTIQNGRVRMLTQEEWLERKQKLDAIGGDCLHRTLNDLTDAE
jgi:WD40 repeat protein